MKFKFACLKYDSLDIDFQKIYDYVKKEYESDRGEVKDKWDIYNYFGDNIDYFIKNIYKYEIANDDEVEYINNLALDEIWNEFGNWLEKQEL